MDFLCHPLSSLITVKLSWDTWLYQYLSFVHPHRLLLMPVPAANGNIQLGPDAHHHRDHDSDQDHHHGLPHIHHTTNNIPTNPIIQTGTLKKSHNILLLEAFHSSQIVLSKNSFSAWFNYLKQQMHSNLVDDFFNTPFVYITWCPEKYPSRLFFSSYDDFLDQFF